MGSPLRVLHVVVNMNRGGAETLIMNLYRNIDRSNVQFDFLTCKKGVFDEEITQMGGKVHRIPYVTEVGPLGFSKALSQFFKSHPEYTVVHAHLDKMSGTVLKKAKQANVPVRIAHSHNTESEGGLVTKLFKWYTGKSILSSATHFYACSQAAATWLFKQKASQAFILKNGIETDKFNFSQVTRKAIRSELKIAEDTFLIGHIGRFNQQKNHLYLLEVFSEIAQQIKNCELILVGDGALRPQIEEKIKALQLESKVKLLGVRDDTNKLHQAFDLLLFPSLHEGLPVTLIEAQGAGLPCLISDAISMEVDMGAGLIELLPLTDKGRWAARVQDLHQGESTRMIDNEILSSKGYDIRSTAKTTETTYLALGGI